MEQLLIRNEKPDDYAAVENITREAFWNLSVPGCNEHYLVHVMRDHEDFVPELDLVAELDGQIVGNVMYTKSKLRNEQGEVKQILTFGPVSILPAYQRKGYGKIMLEESFRRAAELGYEVIVIFGNPDNYVGRGFKSCKKYNVCVGDGIFPAAMLVKELKTGVLDGTRWYFEESEAYNVDEAEAEEFDKQFAAKEKKVLPSQEEFYIHSHSVIR